MKLTQEYLKTCIDYSPDTGIFTWKERPESHFKPGNTSSKSNRKGWKTQFSGKAAGGVEKTDGYVYIRLDCISYLAHRLAWFYVHGYFPENQIDHKDRIRHHNWIDNLREVSQQCNNRNAGMLSNNTSGVKGVYYYKQKKRHVAQIKVNNETINLKSFKNKDNAVMARWKAEVEYGFPNCNTCSSAYLYLKERGLV